MLNNHFVAPFDDRFAEGLIVRQCFYIDRQSESRAGVTGGACFKTAAGVRIEFRDECAGHPELHFQNFEVGICLGSRQ